MLIDDLKSYVPKSEWEEKDKELILRIYNDYKDEALYRELTFAHFSASCFIVNEDITKVLMTFHKIYNNWGWLGGHADGDPSLLNVAIKEAHEESGLENIKLLIDKPISLEVLPVNPHIKKGKFISSHLHLNLTYLMMANENDMLKVKEDESNGLKWVKLEDCVDITNEEIMKPIYNKLRNIAYEYKKNHLIR